MVKYVNAKQLAKRFMSKNKDKLRLSTVINEIEIAEKGLSREVEVVEVIRCKDCKHRRETAHRSYCLPAFGLKQITDLNGFCSYGERKDT